MNKKKINPKKLEQLKKENLDLKELLNKIDERVKHIQHVETLTFDQIKTLKPRLKSIERELEFDFDKKDEEDEDFDNEDKEEE